MAKFACEMSIVAKATDLGDLAQGLGCTLVEAFQQGLRRVGLIENQDIVLDVVWTGDDADQAVSEELRRGAELLIPCGSSASVAAKRQTSTIPIVFLSVGDPIAMGLVESLSPPGHNATGFSDILVAAEVTSRFPLAEEEYLAGPDHSLLMPAALIIGHHFSVSALWKA
jgi:hypothetical protein